MKINRYGSFSVNPYKKQMDQQQKANVIDHKKDKVEISSQGKEMQHVNAFSTERQQKVEELKKQIQQGTYKVEPQDVAKSMIDFYTKNK
nr:flagellar biosynthesis anti-sigma factor FlgM [Bacillus sp. CGMCC 1.16541]